MLRERYQRQIDNLREDLLRLGSMVEHALTRAMRSLEIWDTVIASQVTHDDHEIDEIWRGVEERTVHLLATQQPVLASDLRFMTVVVTIAGELERIGDYANSIAKRVRRMTTYPKLVLPPSQLFEMATHARLMLRMSLDAFLMQDPAIAQSLCDMDVRADEYESLLRAELLEQGRGDAQKLEAVVDLLDIVHALERVADRSTNIGERVIYLVTNDIRELNP